MIKLFIFISGFLFYVLPLSAQNESINTSAVNSSNGEESTYLFVEGGKRTEKPKTVEEQISSYSIEQVNAMINAYNTKLDYVNDLEILIKSLRSQPIIVGYSMGGLLALKLMERGYGKLGICLAPAAPRGGPQRTRSPGSSSAWASRARGTLQSWCGCGPPAQPPF